MEIYKLPNKEFKIIVLWTLSELWEIIYRQLNEIKKIHEQDMKFIKYI